MLKKIGPLKLDKGLAIEQLIYQRKLTDLKTVFIFIAFETNASCRQMKSIS